MLIVSENMDVREWFKFVTFMLISDCDVNINSGMCVGEEVPVTCG
jgi:hypothetical protein